MLQQTVYSPELPRCYVRSVSIVEISVWGQDLLRMTDVVFLITSLAL